MPSPAAGEPTEVLVVDDEPETRDVVGEFCRALGLDVSTAEDGRAAVTAIERAPSRYRIVLTDIQMPGADGFEVLRAARTHAPSAYVVMITGYATLDTALRAVREGAYDYLPKPFALGQLEVVLRRIRDRMRLEDENRMLMRQMESLRDHQHGAGRGDLGWRLGAIEERLSRIEELLKSNV